MKITAFTQAFPDEECCRQHFRLRRESQGVYCKKCGYDEHYWLKAKWQWQCKMCDFRTTLRSGTIMENSNLSVRKWYLAMALMSFTKKPLSAMEMQRQLGHKYDTIWFLMHRIRESMGQRDDMYSICSQVDFDEVDFDEFSEMYDSPSRMKLQKADRPKIKMMKGHLSSGIKREHMRQWHFVMKPRGNSSGNDSAHKSKSKTLLRKGWLPAHNLGRQIDASIVMNNGIVTGYRARRWLQVVTENVRRVINGIFHHIKAKYLRNYLGEFCYKLNRRNSRENLFDRLSMAVAQTYW